MSQTNTNTNNGPRNTNLNQISGRSGRGQGGSSCRGCRDCNDDCENNSIVTYTFEGKIKDNPISKLTITKTGHRAT